VIGFGYKIDNLFRNALGASARSQDFGLRVVASDSGEILLALPGPNPAHAPETLIERSTDFAGHPLHVIYAVPRDLAGEGFRHGLWTTLIGICITGAAVLVLGFMGNRAEALAREVASRREIEDRLNILIRELNHRVRNVMTVAQAVVRLSFSSGDSLGEVQKTCEGRLQALARAMTLLTDADWRSIGLRRLIADDILPFPERIFAKGPDIALQARAAQTFALLFYELATNAAKHGALSVPQGEVSLEWNIDRSGKEPVFRLVWLERGGPAVSVPSRRGFGELLVRRIAPRDVAGHSKVSYDNDGFRYELEAPLKELIDEKPDRPAAPRS